MSKEWSGYWIPLWLNPMISAKKIAEYKRTKSPEYFYNFVAGLPYVNTTDKLSEQALVKCLSDEPNLQEGRVIIGLDSGHNLHYIMMNKDGVFYNGYCPSVAEMGNKPGYDPYDEIEQRLQEYPRSILIADQGGDLIGIRKLQAKYVGRVYLCWFVKETRSKELIRWGERDEDGKVVADRNRVFQMAVDQVNERRIVFNGTKEDWQPFINHALNIYRVKEITGESEDPQYGWRYVWKRKGADHLWLALIYALIGFDRYAQDLAQIIKKDSMMSGIPTGTNAIGEIKGSRFIRGEDYNG